MYRFTRLSEENPETTGVSITLGKDIGKIVKGDTVIYMPASKSNY